MPDLVRRYPDLLCRIRFRTDEVDVETCVCLLVEHQSDPDNSMPLRTLEYGVCYWRDLWDAGPKTKNATIPAIIPIVFCTDATPWSTKRDLGDLIQSPTCPLAVAPVWPILYLNLADQPVEELLRSTKAWHQALAVVRAEHVEKVSVFRGVLTAAIRGIDGLLESNEGRYWRLMDFMMKWVSGRRPEDEHELLFRTVLQSVRPEHQDEIRTMSNKTRLTFEEASELRAQERYELGKLEVCRANLQSLLAKRFGAVSEDVVRRIEESTDIERLKSCVEEVLDITTPEELRI